MTDSIHHPGDAAASAPGPAVTDCLGRTCLKWRADGELTALDLSLVMARLAQVDQEVTAQRQNGLASTPCLSIR